MLDAGKRPLASRSPAGRPVRISIPLRRSIDGVEVELASRDCLRDVVAQDEVRQVCARYQNSLRPVQASSRAEVEEPLDFGADAADGLHLAELVDAARHGDALIDSHVRERAQHGEELAGARAVTLDFAVALLEGKLGAQAERAVLAEHPREIPAQDRHAFRVDAPAELRLALHVDDPLAADPDDGRDAHRLPELDIARAEHAQAVDHADARSAGVERDLAPERNLADVTLGAAGPLASLEPGRPDVAWAHDGQGGRGDRRAEGRSVAVDRETVGLSLRPCCARRGQRAGERHRLFERRQRERQLLAVAGEAGRQIEQSARAGR